MIRATSHRRLERTVRSPVAVPPCLVRTRPLVEPALRAAVSRLPEVLRLPVAYHMGWSAPDGTPAGSGGGKAVRPAISLLAAQAAGGRAEDAVAGAVAIELVHNFSLLHDDVMDGDRERRHRPTVWALYGTGQAILAGDALMNLAVDVLLEAGRPDAARELTSATAGMILGQAEDLAFESRLDVGLEEAVAMASHKTAALLSCAASLGAVLAGAEPVRTEALRAFGFELGVAFQAVDDLLGIWGDPSVTGKPVATDLRQRKKTIPVVHALSDLRGGEALRRALSNGELTDVDVLAAVRTLDACGSRSWTSALAQQHLGAALRALDTATLDPEAVADLRALAAFVARRDF